VSHSRTRIHIGSYHPACSPSTSKTSPVLTRPSPAPSPPGRPDPNGSHSRTRIHIGPYNAACSPSTSKTSPVLTRPSPAPSPRKPTPRPTRSQCVAQPNPNPYRMPQAVHMHLTARPLTQRHTNISLTIAEMTPCSFLYWHALPLLIAAFFVLCAKTTSLVLVLNPSPHLFKPFLLQYRGTYYPLLPSLCIPDQQQVLSIRFWSLRAKTARLTLVLNPSSPSPQTRF